jgi:hypothetical protein
MAQMLRDEDSTERHLSVTRRHARRCRSTAGAKGYADAIEPFRRELTAKQAETIRRWEAEEDAADDVELRDGEAADLVRTVAGRAEEHDRKAPSEHVHGKLLPTGRIGDLIHANAVDPNDLEKLAVRIEALGPAHPLFGLAAEARDIHATQLTAAQAYGEALRQRKLGEAEEELAQAALRRQYEINSLDARKDLGRRAEWLFPVSGGEPSRPPSPSRSSRRRPPIPRQAEAYRRFPCASMAAAGFVKRSAASSECAASRCSRFTKPPPHLALPHQGRKGASIPAATPCRDGVRVWRPLHRDARGSP